MAELKVFSFGQGDDTVGGSRTKKFKAEAGRTYRLGFVWFPGLETGNLNLNEPPKFTMKNRVFIDGAGYVEVTHPEILKLSKEGKPAKVAIGTPIIVWPTDSKGNLDKERLSGGDYSVQEWIFSEDKYKSFRDTHSEFPLGLCDIKATCTDTQFQKMTFLPCRESLLDTFRKKEAARPHFERILADALVCINNLGDSIARTMTLEQVKAKVAGGDNTATAVGSATSGADIDDIVDGILG